MGYTDEQMQNPEYQADAGARYLAKMYQQFGNWRDALQAYHDGPGNVMKAKRGEYTPDLKAAVTLMIALLNGRVTR